MDTDTQERLKKAIGLRKSLNNDSDDQRSSYDSDYPTVEIERIRSDLIKYLGDDTNEALTQLDKRGWKNPFIDETELFATAIHFSEHPFDDIEMEFQRRGIMRKVTIPEHDEDGKKILEHIEHYPIKFEVIPLRTFAKEWMKRRHPVNRLRVKELISMAIGLRDTFNRQKPEENQNQTITNSKRI